MDLPKLYRVHSERNLSIGHEKENLMKGRLIKDEEMNEGSINKKLYINFIMIMGGFSFFTLLVVISAIIQAFSLRGNIWLMQWSTGNNNNNLYSFLVYAEIDLFSLPHSIDELMIEDNSIKGWQKDVRYSVSDYEDSSISFYCENYDISLSPADLQ